MKAAIGGGRIIQFQVFSHTDHHSACIFYNVHAIWFKHRYQHERVSAFKYADALTDGITEWEALIQVYADPQSDNLGVSLRQRLDPVSLP